MVDDRVGASRGYRVPTILSSLVVHIIVSFLFRRNLFSRPPAVKSIDVSYPEK